jgi:hypothetical protein
VVRAAGFTGWAAVAAFVLFGLPSPSRAAPNTRPQLAAASVIPLRWGQIDRGVGVAAGVESEQSARWSTIFEFEFDQLRTDQVSRHEAKSFAGQIGVRIHMVEKARVRPYAEAGLGLRSAGAGRNPYNFFGSAGGSGTPDESSIQHGLTAQVRLGVTSAAYRGAGLFVDAALETVLGNPRDYALAPIRVGLTLP